MTDLQLVRNKLLAAAELIEREGWVRGNLSVKPSWRGSSMRTVDPRTVGASRCVDGALRAAFGYGVCLMEPCNEYVAARNYVGRATGFTGESIERWNDKYANGQSHVIAVLRRAALLCQEDITRQEAASRPQPVLVTGWNSHEYKLIE